MTTAALPLGRRRSRRPSRALGTALLLTPGGIVLIVFALLPLCALLVVGFTRGDGAVTLSNFQQMLGNATYVKLLGRTLLIAFVVTVASIAVGWPAAWALARYTRPRIKPLILGFVIIPYITSQLLLIYGFVSLIQAGGPIMSLLSALGVTSAHTSLMYTPAASILMLIQESIPTALLVMYAASEQVDRSVLEASRTLGASSGFVFLRVIWPLCSAMLGVNFALTFVQTVGAFAEPAILGGPDGQLLGNTISAQLQSGVDDAFAVAMSLVLLVASLAIVGAVTGLLAWSRMAAGGVSGRRRPLTSVSRPRRVKGAISGEGLGR